MVYIIGAGSGNPEYLTVKAARILFSADFVLYVPGLYLENILGYCSNKCEKIKIKSFPLAAQIEFIKKKRVYGRVNMLRQYTPVKAP